MTVRTSTAGLIRLVSRRSGPYDDAELRPPRRVDSGGLASGQEELVVLTDRGPSSIEDSRVAPVGCAISVVGVAVASIRRPLPLVGVPVPLGRRGIANVGQPFAFVGFPVPLVGQALAIARVLGPVGPSLPAGPGGKHPPIGGLSPQDGVPDSSDHDSPAFRIGLAAQPHRHHATVG
jgi:hypothetical protein